ncbi:MAG: hypothetical protein HYU87_00560 [Chloroflexi bacterium]|nr:hypothetical protein [Chloroflexota bacterium]
MAPAVQIGHEFMDFYSTAFYRQLLLPTLDAMRRTGGDWVIYDQYWSYHSLEPPKIAPYVERGDGWFRDASEDELAAMIQGAHDRGMRFALMLELNWDVMRGPWVSWEHNQAFWDASQAKLAELRRGLDRPTPGVNEYWDAWFASYSAFVLRHADIAQRYGADALVVGKQIDGAVHPGNAQRWKALIAKVRERYRGPISYAAWTDEHYSQAEDFPVESLDFIVVYLYNRLSDAERPTVVELRTALQEAMRAQFKPLSQRAGKPVVFLTPFQSRDHGARQQWFEPMAPAPNVGEDLLGQAALYEALFQAVRGEPWVQGVWTWGFWWRDDFDTRFDKGDSSVNKSSSVRNKPAGEIIRRWRTGGR